MKNFLKIFATFLVAGVFNLIYLIFTVYSDSINESDKINSKYEGLLLLIPILFTAAVQIFAVKLSIFKIDKSFYISLAIFAAAEFLCSADHLLCIISSILPEIVGGILVGVSAFIFGVSCSVTEWLCFVVDGGAFTVILMALFSTLITVAPLFILAKHKEKQDKLKNRT